MLVKKRWLSCFAPSVCQEAQAWSRQTVPLAWGGSWESCLMSPESRKTFLLNRVSTNVEEANGFPTACTSAPSVSGSTIKRKLGSCGNKYVNSSFLQQWLGRASFPPLPPQSPQASMKKLTKHFKAIGMACAWMLTICEPHSQGIWVNYLLPPSLHHILSLPSLFSPSLPLSFIHLFLPFLPSPPPFISHSLAVLSLDGRIKVLLVSCLPNSGCCQGISFDVVGRGWVDMCYPLFNLSFQPSVDVKGALPAEGWGSVAGVWNALCGSWLLCLSESWTKRILYICWC